MSWREVARRVRQREPEPPSPPAAIDNAPDTYAREEREAIAFADGGLPLEWASALASVEHGPRPPHVSEAEWRKCLDDVWRRADAHGADAIASGWTFSEVFGVGENWNRLDQRGVFWLAPGAMIVEISPSRILFERVDGTRSKHTKQERSH
jgi:hypothetical protein